MRNFLKFHIACIKHAWRDSWKLANAWYGIWGAPLLWLILWLGRAKLTLPDDPLLSATIIALLSIGATWVAVFVARLVLAPSLLNTELTARIDEQDAQIAALREQASPRLAFGRIKDDLAYDSASKVTAERKLIEIVNVGNEMLRECIVVVERVSFDDGAVVEPRAAIKTTARDADQVSTRFKLSPDIPKELVLASRETGNIRMAGIHRLCLEAAELHLNRGKSGLIEIAAGCEVGQPIRATLRFSVDEKYVLTLGPAEAS